MLHFTCPECGREFETEDSFAGAKVQCSNCDTRFFVPGSGTTEVLATHQEAAIAPEPPVGSVGSKIVISFDDIPDTPSSDVPVQLATRKLSPRQRRLFADYEMMRKRFSSSSYIHLVDAIGNPPEKYIVEYLVRGIERLDGDSVIYRSSHRVEIVLPGTYPRTPPTCRMLTPIFHPNIEPAVICIGDHWTAGERLCDLVVRIGEIITYQSYNIKSPLDGEAAMWADLHQDFLPIDNCDLMPPEQ